MLHPTAPIWGDERLPERFWDKVYPCPMSGCWIWGGGLQSNKYSSFYPGTLVIPGLEMSAGRRNVCGHVVAYSVLIDPIPPGFHVDHLCRVKWCVNPGHLEAVPPRVNYLRGTSPWAVNARKKSCLRGHLFDVPNTYIDSKGDRVCRACKAAWARNASRRMTEALSAS